MVHEIRLENKTKEHYCYRTRFRCLSEGGFIEIRRKRACNHSKSKVDSSLINVAIRHTQVFHSGE